MEYFSIFSPKYALFFCENDVETLLRTYIWTGLNIAMDTINMKLLAEKLNLSVSTVSKAFRNSYDISEETKNKILSLAAELNYQPNPLASSLRTQRTRTIAVVLPEIANNFFALAINGIESVAQKMGYHVLIYITHEDYNKELAFTRHLLSGRVDGVLMSLSGGTDDFKHIRELQEKEIPLVFFDRVYESDDVAKVTTNDHDSGYLATKHLIEQGCKKIAHLTTAGNLSVAKKRKEGYLDALRDHKMPVNKELIVAGSNNEKDYELVKAMLKKHKPDGVFSAFEKFAMNAYQACEELGLNIPRYVKFISFSNLEFASLLKPSLTTITQPAYNIGERAASILFDALKKKTVKIPPGQVTLDATLYKRDSTK
jgi:LacI family transcriptional regulator